MGEENNSELMFYIDGKPVGSAVSGSLTCDSGDSFEPCPKLRSVTYRFEASATDDQFRLVSRRYMFESAYRRLPRKIKKAKKSLGTCLYEMTLKGRDKNNFDIVCRPLAKPTTKWERKWLRSRLNTNKVLVSPNYKDKD